MRLVGIGIAMALVAAGGCASQQHSSGRGDLPPSLAILLTIAKDGVLDGPEEDVRFGNACVINERVLLTAAHVVPRESGQLLADGEMYSYQVIEARPEDDIAYLFLGRPLTKAYPEVPVDLERDIPIGSDLVVLGWLTADEKGNTPYPVVDKGTVVPAASLKESSPTLRPVATDKNTAPAPDAASDVLKALKVAIAVDSGSTPGMSGSPAYLKSPEGWVVVGINYGGAQRGRRVFKLITR